MDEQIQKLLVAKDTIIEQLEEQNELLKDLAESRRLAHMHQCKELAEHRQFVHTRNHPWRFFWWLVLRNVWPFSIWYSRFD
jgi:hypothetical protein